MANTFDRSVIESNETEMNMIVGGNGKQPPKDEGPQEEITFVYGALQVSYGQQGVNGAL